MNDIISVIVPIYNAEEYLDKCITSIVNQNYFHLEIILVNDGSTDRCAAICNEWKKKDSRIKVIHQINQGQSVARNAALDCCNGRYVVFVDADDYVDADYIGYLYDLLTRNDSDIAICEYQMVTSNGIKLNKVFDDDKQWKLDTKQALVELCLEKKFSSSPCAKIYKKELFDDIYFPNGRVYEDLATVYRLFLKAEKIVFGRCCLYYYLRHNNSTMTTQNYQKIVDAICFAEEMCKDITEYCPELEGIAKYRLFVESVYAFRTVCMMANSDLSKASLIDYLYQIMRDCYRNAIVYSPMRRMKLYAFASIFGRKTLEVIASVEVKTSRFIKLRLKGVVCEKK